MPFDLSQVAILPAAPWRYTTEPTFNADGTIATPGVKASLSGVFILLSDELVTRLRETMTAAQKTEVAAWVTRLTIDDLDPLKRPETWNVPVWAGQSSAVYWRIPASIWSNPADPVPLKVRNYFRELWRES